MSLAAPPSQGRTRLGVRVRLTPAGAALTLATVVLAFALIVPVRTLLQQRSDLSRLQQQEQLLNSQNAALKTQVAKLQDPAYLERVARECLGMTRPGEISFVVVPKGPPAKGSSGSGALPFDPSHAATGC